MSDPRTPLRRIVACESCARQVVLGAESGEPRLCVCGSVLPAPAIVSHEASVVRCSACGGPRQGDLPSCGFCGADFTLHEQDLRTVCPGCAARISDRARFCHHCGLAITPDAGASESTERVCPACGDRHPLSSRRVGEDIHLLECDRCAGFWLSTAVFTRLEQRAKSDEVLDAAILTGEGGTEPPSLPSEGRIYRPCPSCGALMNRRNYGKRSGFVVDVCKDHGIWFDHGELAGILGWIRTGGGQRAALREAEDQRLEAWRERDRREAARPDPVRSAGPIPGGGFGGGAAPGSGGLGRALLDADVLVDVVVFLGRLGVSLLRR